MKKIFIIKLLLLVSFLYPQIESPSNQAYITNEDGLIKMYLNIIGHVAAPGNYLVYDGVDLMTAISIAGGYLPGSNLKKITVYSGSGESKKINLNEYLSNKKINSNYLLKPNDTIHIQEKIGSKIFTSSNLPALFLSLLNILLTIERTSD